MTVLFRRDQRNGTVGAKAAAPAPVVAKVGLTGELDLVAHAAAYGAALSARLHPSLSLFVNADPAGMDTPVPKDLAGVVAQALTRLRVLMEVSERSLTADPHTALAAIERARANGWGVALDDLGTAPDSLALMPFVQPDVVKLDVALVHDRFHPNAARVVNAVIAYAERSGASILAEGIESEEHLRTALGMGAVLGQGYHFGRPRALPVGTQTPHQPVRLVAAYERTDPATTPFCIAAAQRDPAPADSSMLETLAHYLEQRAAIDPEPPVVICCLQGGQTLSGASVATLEMIARNAGFVAALMHETPRPVPGVRMVGLPEDDPLRNEVAFAVVGPHFAALLTARQKPGTEDRYTYVLTYDRSTVVDAARVLLQRVAAEQPR
jgi:EAL domain-containing protein (putative c-di-GMP-specific phosphodiesterase class I)